MTGKIKLDPAGKGVVCNQVSREEGGKTEMVDIFEKSELGASEKADFQIVPFEGGGRGSQAGDAEGERGSLPLPPRSGRTLLGGRDAFWDSDGGGGKGR